MRYNGLLGVTSVTILLIGGNVFATGVAVAAAGNVSTLAGSGLFDWPTGVAVDASGPVS